MSGQPIEFWNPSKGAVEKELVYGEPFLRFAYESKLGSWVLWALLKRALFSKIYGWRMDQASSASKIDPFVQQYAIDMADYRVPERGFRTFNEFFYRELADGARPLAGSVALFPADGRHWAISTLGEETCVYAKGHRFNLKTLLEGTDYAHLWAGGSALISRLCPVDYHRFHAPVDGVCEAVIDLRGPLYSVSPIALRRSLDYLLVNKRRLILLKTEAMGRVAVIPIGATCVGSIETSIAPGDSVGKGQELGYFKFGGSCVISLFESGALEFKADFAEAWTRNIEYFDRMGSSIV